MILFLHFLLSGDSGRKDIIFGRLPTVNLPDRSHHKESKKRKLPATRVEIPSKCKIQDCVYKDFKQLRQRVTQLKTLSTWSIVEMEDRVVLNFISWESKISKFEIVMDDSLGYTILVYGWLLPENHIIYKQYKRSMKNVNILNLVNDIHLMKICNGIPPSSSCIIHSVPVKIDPLIEDASNPFPQKTWHRYINCKILCKADICELCLEFLGSMEKSNEKHDKKLQSPASVKAPVSLTSPIRIKLTLQEHRLKCKQLEERIEKMKFEIEKSSISVDSVMSDDLLTLFSEAESKDVTPFMNLFWEQQKKLASCRSSTGYRFHPMIIRFCLSLASRSSSCYEELRNSGVLVLPSQRTLKDYRNFIKPQCGFNPKVIKELREQTKDLFDVERYIVMLFDEMKIRSNLVFDKETGQIIGFTDLGDLSLNFASHQEDELASHILVFLLRGVCSNLKFPFAYFATHKMQAYQLMSIFWEAVYILEKSCNLWIIATTADGASTNRSFFRMHKYLDGSGENEFCYR